MVFVIISMICETINLPFMNDYIGIL